MKGKRLMKRIIATPACSSYGSYSFTCNRKRKKVKAESAPYNLEAFNLDEVTITDDYYLSAQESDINFLCQFDADRLLSRFRETAGLDTQGKNLTKDGKIVFSAVTA